MLSGSAMERVPDKGQEPADREACQSGQQDQYHRRRRLEGANDILQVDHVHPQHEIDERLAPADGDQNRPDQVPAAQEQRPTARPALLQSTWLILFVPVKVQRLQDFIRGIGTL